MAVRGTDSCQTKKGSQMSQEKETFFDKSTLMAIFLLVLCWIGWDSYMKKKYPRQTKPIAAPQEKVIEPKTLKKAEKNTLQIKPKFEETEYIFSGEKMEIIFSSWGLGFKKIQLKSFTDRKGRPVVFSSPGQESLSATGILGAGGPIPFRVRQERNRFIGHYISQDLEITKTVEVDEANFIFRVHTDISKRPAQFSGLRLFFYHPVPKSIPEPWYSKMLFVAGRDISGGFIFSEKGGQQIMEQELKGTQNHTNLSVLGLGSKYFGQAFINKSSLLPSGTLQREEGGLQGFVDYKPLTQGPMSLTYQVFYGPKSLEYLSKQDVRLGKWINFGFFEWLARPLLRFLRVFHKVTGNWGVAIILLTFLVRLLLLPLNIRSYKSMKIMQRIQPQLQALREKHKKDPQQLNREMMALMKTHKANPLGGCLPLMLVQLPVFIALYRVLGESIELYQAPFVFWIRDLSLYDPLYILPVLSGLTLFVQQKITPMNVPPAQARLLTFMPLVFSVFMLKFPSGLTLYIFVSGLFGLIQQFFFVKVGGASESQR